MVCKETHASTEQEGGLSQASSKTSLTILADHGFQAVHMNLIKTAACRSEGMLSGGKPSTNYGFDSTQASATKEES